MNKIDEKIELIPPLPETVTNINRIANNPDTSVKELAKEIKKDPIATASILTEARSAQYGFKNMNTIEKAIAQFGKEISKSIAIDTISKNTFDIDVTPYGITNNEFLNISQKRSFLMMKWFARVDFRSLKILSLSSLIGNIGQILLANLIIESDKVDDFQDILSESKDIFTVEEEIFGVNSIDTTCIILEKWGFDKTIIDVIKKSQFSYIHNEENELDKVVLANYIVYTIVDNINSNKLYEISGDIENLVIKYNLRLDLLELAVEELRN